MYPLLRPLLFTLDPERAHALTLRLLQLAGELPPVRAALRRVFAPPETNPVEIYGLTFSNPIGLAAGYDKDGLAWRGLASLGFGHIEVGTVTPLPQPGNSKPRLFRLPPDQALINRLGFPGRGAEFVAHQLQKPRPPNLILGVNLGKNKDTPLEEAARDYEALMPVFAPLSDYLVVNVSSPNTIGLRRLQARQHLEELLSLLEPLRHLPDRRVPLLVKLSPDLSDSELDDALEAIAHTGMDGVIAANTTLSREGLRSPAAGETGGLSGAPLRDRSTAMVRKIHQRTNGKLPIIGVGGIMNAADAQKKLDAGASLVQVFTGLIYNGPGLVKGILKDLESA